MATSSVWNITEPDLRSIFEQHRFPLEELAAGAIPAIVLRGVYSETRCSRLIDRLIAEELLYDPYQPAPEKFRQLAIPEGF